MINSNIIKFIPNHWLFLVISIIFEVAGTSIMKMSHGWDFAYGSQVGLMIMFGCIAFSYFSLSKAAVVIPIGVAFALWDAVGLILIVMFSVLFLEEILTFKQILGLLCVLVGGLLVHHGTQSH